MLIKRDQLLYHIIIISILLITITECEYRPIDGQGNNRQYPSDGGPLTPLGRFPNITQYGPSPPEFQMVSTPGDYGLTGINDPATTCNATLPSGDFPLPRCVSNLITSMRLQNSDPYTSIDNLEKFKSKRKNSHILTYWAFFVRMDIVTAPARGQNVPKGVYIPLDDGNYLSSYLHGPQASDFAYNDTAFAFNRSEDRDGHTGINTVTSFLDASTIYGSTEQDLQKFRDVGNNGKMKLLYFSTPDGQFGYPPQTPTGDYNVGITSPTKNVFTDLFATIFLREHNRLCDEFYATHGNEWTDEMYFQEARKWVIAFIQRITFYEYLGTALGVPPPPYSGYKPEIRPIIDTFFSTVSFRYGHSEISDFYNMLNGQGDLLAVLSLHDLKIPGLLGFYGVPSLILSLALQRQEEVDIYFSEFMRRYLSKPFEAGSKPVDIAALDIVRSRDHGIPSYNDAREAFDLSRKQTFAQISSDPVVQQKLQSTYATVDQIEAFMGGLAEDHINGGNYGELISSSFNQTWLRIRDSDRFWYENQEVSGFSNDDISKIHTTTLSEIIKRNTPSSSNYPQNLWFVQPSVVSTQPNQGYGFSVSLSDGFNMQWKIEGSDVVFLITVSSINSWFGIGFNPDGAAMQGTDMMVFWNSNDGGKNGVIGKNYLGVGRAVKPRLLPDDDQIIELLDRTNVENGFTTVEVRRPLNAKHRKSLIGQITMVYAWNLNSKNLSYHGGNRDTKEINLLTGESSGFINSKGKRLLLMHGIAMFSIWGVLFPSSVWIVRYLRHIDSYMTQHRNLNILGGAVVAAFGAVAMSVVDFQASSPHGITGLVVFGITGLQIALGLLAIWALANVESASTGIVRYLKHFHFYLGGALLLTAWANIYLGIIQFDIKYSGNGANKPYIWAYTGWLGMFGLIITGSEFYYRIRNMQFLWPARYTKDSSRRIRSCIPDNVYENLPSITWNEFNQRVMTGASLVIAEGLVFDVHRWIPIHPGGQKILQRVIGTDITDDFFFDPSVKTVINSNFSKKYDEKVGQHSISVLTDNTYREKDPKEDIKKPYSVANAVDMINATAFRNRRVAMHQHSKFATAKLASMVIARVVDPINESVHSPSSPTITSKQTKLRDINISVLNSNDGNDVLYSPYVFRRYILTNIETVSRSDSENPVKKFTFQVIHPKDRLPKFLPGDYIEIMSFANNHVMIRPYTPLQGPTENSFCILVKIYRDGAMSQHLNKQLKNFEIKVRGPFDIADRMLQTTLSSSIKTPSITSRPSSPSFNENRYTSAWNSDIKQRSVLNRGNSIYSSGIGNINVGYNNNLNIMLDGRSGILLNKERDDLCWDHLFMVCGGTGITPMLQLIQYHLDKASTGSNFNLYLLNANDTIADLIQPAYLDYLCTVLKGRLRITYILSKPPPIWRGLAGMIDETLLFDWIYQNYSVPPPAIPPRLSANYGTSGGSGSKTHSMASTNTITNYNPPGSKTKNQVTNPMYDLEEIQDIPTQQQQQQYDPRLQFNAPNDGMPTSPVQMQTTSPEYPPNSQNLPYFSPLYNNPHHTNEMLLLNERYNYMKSLATDNTNQVKLIVCGSSKFNDSIRKSLERLGFPIDEKALFIV